MDPRYTFLSATDFTPAADHALAWTAALAEACDAAIELLHVLPAPTANIEALATDAAVLDSARFAAVEQRLRALAGAAQDGLGVAVRPRLAQGDPHRAIVAAADEVGAKLIALGSRGQSAAGRWIRGSTAERTLRAARCPVAVVPHAEHDRDGVVARMRDQVRPLRVLAGIDLGPAGDRIAELADELGQRRACLVTLLHLYWPPEEYARLGLPGPRELFEDDADVVRDLEGRMRQRLGAAAARRGVRLSVRAAWGDPASNLLATAEGEGYDLLVVGADQRHGLARIARPSVAGRLAARPGGVPVICVPPAPAAGDDDTAAAAHEPLPALTTILAATDLSPTGNRAVRHAYALLRAEGGVVELCHVHERALPTPSYVYDDPRGRLDPARRAALEAALRALVPPEAEGLGIATHVTVVDGGEAATAILQAAERFDVDAVSIGSHGRGSVAGAVVRRSRRPVLVVRGE
jgi:nucleotide-binding universal stress UspA family protein